MFAFGFGQVDAHGLAEHVEGYELGGRALLSAVLPE